MVLRLICSTCSLLPKSLNMTSLILLSAIGALAYNFCPPEMKSFIQSTIKEFSYKNPFFLMGGILGGVLVSSIFPSLVPLGILLGAYGGHQVDETVIRKIQNTDNVWEFASKAADGFGILCINSLSSLNEWISPTPAATAPTAAPTATAADKLSKTQASSRLIEFHPLPVAPLPTTRKPQPLRPFPVATLATEEDEPQFLRPLPVATLATEEDEPLSAVSSNAVTITAPRPRKIISKFAMPLVARTTGSAQPTTQAPTVEEGQPLQAVRRTNRI